MKEAVFERVTEMFSALLPSLTDEHMVKACGITNPIHRLKLKQAFRGKANLLSR